MKTKLGVFFLFTFVNLVLASASWGAPPFMMRAGVEGHYKGVMDLTYDRALKINIEVTLTLTGETQVVQVGDY
jgi:hypothetical protein